MPKTPLFAAVFALASTVAAAGINKPVRLDSGSIAGIAGASLEMRLLSDTMSPYLVNFAMSGDPNGKAGPSFTEGQTALYQTYYDQQEESR